MYQLARTRELDQTELFVQTCTSMTATPENLGLVRSATSLFRSALERSDLAPLRDFVRRTEEWCEDVDDVIAAAGQAVIDEMHDVPRTNLHDVVRRVAQIERDLFAGIRRTMEGPMRAVYAG